MNDKVVKGEIISPTDSLSSQVKKLEERLDSINISAQEEKEIGASKAKEVVRDKIADYLKSEKL